MEFMIIAGVVLVGMIVLAFITSLIKGFSHMSTNGCSMCANRLDVASDIFHKIKEVSGLYPNAIGLAAARTQLKVFLYNKGYKPEDVVTGKGNTLNNLASSKRLDLILEKNAELSCVINDLNLAGDSDIRLRFPNEERKVLRGAKNLSNGNYTWCVASIDSFCPCFKKMS